MHTHYVRLLFKQNRIYDEIDRIYFVLLQIADGTRITLKILVPMAKGDAHQPSELETRCHHGWAIELDMRHPSAEGQQRGYATIFYLNMCA